MKAAGIQEIKQELKTLNQQELAALCLRMARYRKENKELLTYLLYEAGDEDGYIAGVKEELEELFGAINFSHIYFARKSLRKIVRVINKYCRYSGNKQTEIELRIWFCTRVKDAGIPYARHPALLNLYEGQLKKIRSLLESLHEDLQYDYVKRMEALA